jgi:hypothetical protein
MGRGARSPKWKSYSTQIGVMPVHPRVVLVQKRKKKKRKRNGSKSPDKMSVGPFKGGVTRPREQMTVSETMAEGNTGKNDSTVAEGGMPVRVCPPCVLWTEWVDI